MKNRVLRLSLVCFFALQILFLQSGTAETATIKRKLVGEMGRDTLVSGEITNGDSRELRAAISANDKEIARQLDYLSPVAPSTVEPLEGAAQSQGCVGLTTAYTLFFRNFESSEITLVGDYLVSFRGDQHHRPIRASATESTYWYESCIEPARLNRNLRLMTEHMGVEVWLGMVQNRFEIDKIRTPKMR